MTGDRVPERLLACDDDRCDASPDDDVLIWNGMMTVIAVPLPEHAGLASAPTASEGGARRQERDRGNLTQHTGGRAKVRLSLQLPDGDLLGVDDLC
jgi:hypothetical protein